MKDSIFEIFGEDWEEVLNEIRYEENKEASNVEDNLSYNSGWYNYSILKFDYNEKRYSIQYKEHTSDNVSDFEFLIDTFTEYGLVEELNQTITKEELILMKKQYESMLAGKDQTIKSLREKNENLMKIKNAFVLKNNYSNEIIRKQGESFMEAYKGDTPTEKFITKLGESMVNLSKVL